MPTRAVHKGEHRFVSECLVGLTAVWVGLGVSAVGVNGADKSGVGPNTISLPKGPGSIEGLGESFQPTLNTGTAKYAVGLKVPSGPLGQAPEVQLVYEGGSGNGILGFGWQLPLRTIQRRSDKGIPLYSDEVPPTDTEDWSARYHTFIDDAKEELVPLSNGTYFCKNEGAFIRYRWVSRGTNAYWEATLPDGTRLEYGLSPEGRIEDASSGSVHVFAWLLQRQTDTHGSTLVYSYASFSGEANRNQKYLTEIRYGPGAPPWTDFHFVSFQYEDRPDWFEDCRAGFPVCTGKRLKAMLVGTQGPALVGHLAGDFNGDGKTDYLVRKYELDYARYAGTSSHWSLLGSIQQVGADGISRLPPMTFGYRICDPPLELSAVSAAGVSPDDSTPAAVMDSALVDFIDLNGDGLPDILETGGAYHIGYINRGESYTQGHRIVNWGPPQEIKGDRQAWQVDLRAARTMAENVAHLADVDGNGLADFVYQSSAREVYYFPNLGKMRWEEAQLLAHGVDAPPSPFGDQASAVKTMDVDFDKGIDIIRSLRVGGTYAYQVWYSLGGQRYSAMGTCSPKYGFDLSQPEVQIADLNGDRVPDIARISDTEIELIAGLGYGRFTEARSIPIPGGLPSADQALRAKLIDVNGDGLADLVLEPAPDGALWYWLNLGNYRLAPRRRITDLPSLSNFTSARRWADLNGNGTVDLVYANSTQSPRLQSVDLGELLGCVPNPNTLYAISNGLGRVTLIGYQPSTVYALEDAAAGQPWSDPMPFPVSVVSSVTNLDSLGHQYLTQYRYHQGYYDPQEKQFRGFARVEQIEVGDLTAPTLVTQSQFDTGRQYESMKGKLLVLSAQQEDGKVFWTETNFWTLPPVGLYLGTNGTNVQYTHPTGKVRLITELGQGTPRRLETDYAYDHYGNLITNADYGIVENGDRSAFNDERITVTQYALNTNAWIIRLPFRQEIMDELGQVISRAESFYDDETFVGKNGGQVILGNLTLKREWIVPDSPTNYVQSTRRGFDVFGNATTLLDSLAAAPGGQLDLTQGHVRQIDYDARFHTFPVKETIHVGSGKAPLVFQAAYDVSFGTVTNTIDFNTNPTVYGYDVFGRIIQVVKPGDTTEYPTIEYDYALAVPVGNYGLVNYTETRLRDKTELRTPKSEMYFISRDYIDGFGRKLMTKTEAEPETDKGPQRVTVKAATIFDARQKPHLILNPYFSTLSGDLEARLAFESIEAPGWSGQFHKDGQNVTLDLLSAHQTATDYDALLRETEITNQDGTKRRNVYEPLLTKSFDENDTDLASPDANTPIIHYADGLGRLICVEETTRLSDDGTSSGDIKTWPTRYEYDLNDQVTKVTDSQNNVKGFEYDGLKRKTFMNDPDRGVMRWNYDEASNLKETTDAKEQRITYTYDGANRMLTEKYHDGLPLPSWRFSQPSSQLSTTCQVVYHYDSPVSDLPQGDNTTATARNVQGQLVWIEDLSGEEHNSYDSRGRVEWTVKRIPDLVFLSSSNYQTSQLVSYRTGFAYDSLDRLMNLVYPDNDKVNYEYNDRMLLRRIPGGPHGNIISNITYWPSGQQEQIDYGNSVRTTYAYDSRLLLNELSTLNPQLGSELVHFTYDFDGASNIRQITDQRPGGDVIAGNPRRNTQLYQYDDLYRLVRAQYSFNLPGQALRNDGEINYYYDRIGNMLAQSSTITKQENGYPLVNLGQITSGGSSGRWDRNGHAAADPPGPHALSQISNPQYHYTNRVYTYDANGNMTIFDGLTNNWDFKDRLVAVENDQMGATYAYDYSDRRIAKTVTYKPRSSYALTNHPSWIAASYINKYFEIREHDAPTKYIWSGLSRIARVTGSLSGNLRVQRFRVYPGWNLCSLAVSGPLAASETISEAFRWNPATLGWDSLILPASLSSGSVLWLLAATNATLSIVGTYQEPASREINNGAGFFPSAGLEMLALPSAISNPTNCAISFFDAPAKGWVTSLPQPLYSQCEKNFYIAPGQALFVKAEASTDLESPESSLNICFYHADYLGSPSVVSDSDGRPIQDVAYFPFGCPRNEYYLHGPTDNYRFTGKERDAESALSYFEARYLGSVVGRFISTDPAVADPALTEAFDPQAINAYSYGKNNPVVQKDPTGCFSFKEFWAATTSTPVGRLIKMKPEERTKFVEKSTENVKAASEVSATVTTAIIGGDIELGAEIVVGIKSAGAFVARKIAERAKMKALLAVGEKAEQLAADASRAILSPANRAAAEEYVAREWKAIKASLEKTTKWENWDPQTRWNTIYNEFARKFGNYKLAPDFMGQFADDAGAIVARGVPPEVQRAAGELLDRLSRALEPAKTGYY
jgi:RHS repeat-associated protein